MHNPAPVLENNTHKLLGDFNIQTDNNNQQKEDNLQNCRLFCPGWPQNKPERMWKEGWVPRTC